MSEQKRYSRYIRTGGIGGKRQEASRYVSVGGTDYNPGPIIGEGAYGAVRKLLARGSAGSGKKRVVLNFKENNGPIDVEEVKRKERFFKMLYSSKTEEIETETVKLFDFTHSGGKYRLVLPEVPGVPYDKYAEKITSAEQQIDLFISAVQALKDCHEKGLILIDLKGDNIFYDSTTKTSYLIDGGLSCVEGEPLPPTISHHANNSHIEDLEADYPHMAPECWLKKSVATKSMDIYSLGDMMQQVFARSGIPINNFLQEQITLCMQRNPNDRPSLKNLAEALSKARPKIVEEAARIAEEETRIMEEKRVKREAKILFWQRFVPVAIATLGVSLILYLLNWLVRSTIGLFFGFPKKMGKKLNNESNSKAVSNLGKGIYAFFILLETVSLSLLSPFSIYHKINRKYPRASKVFIATVFTALFFFAASAITGLIREIFNASSATGVIGFFASVSSFPGFGWLGTSISNVLVNPFLEMLSIPVEPTVASGMTTFLVGIILSEIAKACSCQLIKPPEILKTFKTEDLTSTKTFEFTPSVTPRCKDPRLQVKALVDTKPQDSVEEDDDTDESSSSGVHR